MNSLLHADVYNLRRFENLDIDQYNNTHSNIDIGKNEQFVRPYFFFRNVNTLYQLRKILIIVRNSYPSFNGGQLYWGDFNVEYFLELMNFVRPDEFSIGEMNDCIKKYEETNDKVLLYLAECMKKYVSKCQNTGKYI